MTELTEYKYSYIQTLSNVYICTCMLSLSYIRMYYRDML